MGRGNRESNPGPALIVVTVLHIAQHALQVVPPRAEQHQLDALGHEPLVVVNDEVHPLLVIEAPDESQHGHVGIHRQPQFPLQGCLTGGLALPIVVHAVPLVPIRLEVHVHGRVPVVDVYPVHDAAQLPVDVPDHPVQPPPSLRRLAFPRVPIAHRHNPVRLVEARLQHVHVLAADGIVQAEQLCVVIRNLQVVQFVHRRPTLVRNVVDDKHRPGKHHLPVVPVVRVQVDRQQRRMPVVGDEHQRLVPVDRAPARHHLGRLQRGLAEQSAPKLQVLPAAAVDVVPERHITAVVYEHKVDAVDTRVEVAVLVVLPHHPDPVPHPRLPHVLVALVPGSHHHHPVATLRKKLGKRPHHVPQTPRL
mmetsp:Transcript_10895/g.30468  ORF Transcript_10895/g.30468 Transcript_10895/m.30468 type:complete len:362 (+) Transcript_10895:4025-5110(+)